MCCHGRLTDEVSYVLNRILIGPTKTIVDSWIQFLDWYQQCTLELKSISSSMISTAKSVNKQSIAMNENIWGNILFLVADGFDVLESTRVDGKKWDDKDKNKIVKRAENGNNQRLPSKRLLSIGKSPQCRQLLENVANFDLDESNGVIFRCHLILWQSVAREFLHRLQKKGRKKPLVEHARKLISQLPSNGNEEVDFQRLAAKDILIHNVYHFDILPLQKYIRDFDSLQKDSKEALEECRDYVEGKQDMCDLLVQFKSLRSRFRVQHESGLSDDCTHGKEIDRRIKDISFILSASEYESALIKKCKQKIHQDFGCKRIPLDDLLSISDRVPTRFKIHSDVKDLSGLDIELSLVSERVMELCKDADGWERDVKKCIPIPTSSVSRATTRLASASQNNNTVDELNPRESKSLNIEELKRLLEDPLLNLVSVLMNTVEIGFFPSECPNLI